ncbi:protein of unknown function [Magnetospirillum sp. XM-1]|uniref:TIGR04372 family glycosyltransferase n=1 Tax=Magnetospirillum sp. XM-1 TaxID=1663591 RepID=UPI00073DCF81|nr:TIGR04372 family glycosyltransferase [Magnetospirillum sp. XM-1]CUW38013.1 protein of unknown function [Magnetospirillum sp. XM-1]
MTHTKPGDRLEAVLVDVLSLLLKGIVLLASPFVTIRIGLIGHRSLGRLVGAMEYYIRTRDRGMYDPREYHILVSGTNPVNRQVLTMIRRRLPVVCSDLLWVWLKRIQEKGPVPTEPTRAGPPARLPLWLNLSHTGFMVEWETWQAVSGRHVLMPEEERRGREILRILGIPEGARWVCMHARDLAHTDNPDFIRHIENPLALNDFRDCDIQNYLVAADWLTSQGIWVVRMGAQVVGPLVTDNPMIIDYASRFRRHLPDAEFADVYLAGRSKFFLGCTAAVFFYAKIFDVPICNVDMVPLAEPGRQADDIFILKKYWHRHEERFMRWQEMVDRGWDWHRAGIDHFAKLKAEGIDIVNNSPEEVLGAVMEMNARIDGSWKGEADDAALQAAFRGLFPHNHPMTGFPGYVGADFCRRNRELLPALAGGEKG